MPRGVDGYYEPHGTVHFNVIYKGGGIGSRLTVRAVCGLPLETIDRIWIVELCRNASPEEIAQLCAGHWKSDTR